KRKKASRISAPVQGFLTFALGIRGGKIRKERPLVTLDGAAPGAARGRAGRTRRKRRRRASAESRAQAARAQAAARATGSGAARPPPARRRPRIGRTGGAATDPCSWRSAATGRLRAARAEASPS